MLVNVPLRLASTALLLSSFASAQKTWWVDVGAPSNGNGHQATPFARIQDAIDISENGDFVRVRPGTYFENIHFDGKSIEVASIEGAGITIIDGGENGPVAHLCGIAPILVGFTLQHGSGGFFGYPGTIGGGVLFEDTTSGATVRNCIVHNNYATRGDGVAAYEGIGTVIGCTIENNGGSSYPGWCQVDDNGGGAYGPAGLVLDSCTLRNNWATLRGGGVYGCTLINCLVETNHAAEGGGLSHSIAYSTRIERNTAYTCDEGFTAAGGADDCTLEGCWVVENSAFDQAGGTRGGVAIRCVFVGNSCAYGAGALATTLDLCTVYGNLGQGYDGGLLGTNVRSSIVRGNTGVQVGGNAFVRYSNVEGGWSGPGNIDLDPRLWNAAARDFHLQPTSPCIDAGEPGVLDPDGTRCDMGAFPYTASDCLAPVAYCPAGASSNGCVSALQTLGLASVSASSGFEIRATNLPGVRLGVVIYGVSGEIQAPWGSTSFMCIAPPRQRTGLQSTGGTIGACDGELAFDFNAWRASHPFALGALFAPGDVVYAQAWYRDPAAALTSNLTAAVRFVTCP